MRILSTIAGCTVLFVTAISVAAGEPKPDRRDRPYAQATPYACTAKGRPSFVGFSGAGSDSNLAGGDNSSVTAGTGNRACGASSAVVAGVENFIEYYPNSGTANYTYSLVTAGYFNSIAYLTLDSFDGAGNAAYVQGNDAFTGSGVGNYSLGDGAFMGSGSTLTYSSSDNSTENRTGGTDVFEGAGDASTAGFAGSYSRGTFVGAGEKNYAGGVTDSVPGGFGNTASNFGGDDAVLGGNTNYAGGGNIKASYAVVIGGNSNRGAGNYVEITGGSSNRATPDYAMAIGGLGNTAAGRVDLVAGSGADAKYDGSFIWADDGTATVSDTATDQFIVRASGGVSFYSNETKSSGVTISPGSGTWASLSDVDAKTDIVPADGESLLAKITSLPVSAWRYRPEEGVRHAGPMAQDFYKAFELGADERHITSIDEDGVALAAVKTLSSGVRQRDAQIVEQRREIAGLWTELHSIQAKIWTKHT